MTYFYQIMLTAKEDQTQTIYLILPPDENNREPPALSKEQLIGHTGYKAFMAKYKPKKAVAVDFVTYRTNFGINASTPDERMNEIAADSEAVERMNSGELIMEPGEKQDKKTGKVRKKKKVSGIAVTAIALGAVVLTGGGIIGGIWLGKKFAAVPVQQETVNTAEDGLIIPVQQEIESNAEQVTVTIDRSYSPTPVEDLQLKGAVIGGTASITLPEFDKEDFFTHVQGYTWGFTSDPDGKKIEYYGGQTYGFTKDTKLYRVLVKYGGGNGTKDDPYRIDYFDQLELMGEEKARGYFVQTADITFPSWAKHTPINTVNELKADPESECFAFDGGGFVIENLDAPLFGTVSGALIQNVNIRNSRIESDLYQDYGFIVCTAYNYHYKTETQEYETGETRIRHCTVSHSSIHAQYPETDEQPAQTTAVVTAPPVTPPDVIEYDEEGNPIETTAPPVIEATKHAEHCVGAISGSGGEISDCYVTDFGIFTYLNDYFLYAGGISGKPAGVTNSCVYYYSAQGNIFNAGGIAGSAAGTRAYDAKGNELPQCYGGSIRGCTARNIILKSETLAGGIAAESATDAEGAVIASCTANELHITCGTYEDAERKVPGKAGTVGGILGADGSGKHGHLVTNCVSLADFPVIGKSTKSEFDDTVRLAPAYAFYQKNILTVLNRNTVDPVNPKDIFTGTFTFSADFGDETGMLPYPETIGDLFAATIVQQGG